MKTKMNLARGASASKKLLAAIAVLAVAFVVFAAIPAVDATDSKAGAVEDGAVLANATVKTFEELVQANADSSVQRIDVPNDASIVITETFTAVKPVYFSTAGAGSINLDFRTSGMTCRSSIPFVDFQDDPGTIVLGFYDGSRALAGMGS